MNILILTGSPHKNGTSSYLTDRFIEGASENGHSIYRFDAAFEEVHPCIACETCKAGPCIYNDSMEKLRPYMDSADLVVYVTPMYSHAMTAQLKAVVDRFHCFRTEMRSKPKKSMLIMTAAANNNLYTGVVGTYLESLRHNKWQDIGMLLAVGCPNVEELLKTDFPQKAYEMGKSL